MRAASLALATAALMLAGCGGSSSAGNVSYTLSPRSPLGAGISVQISGPPTATRLVLQRFEASRQGDFVSASGVSGPKDCAISAGGGKVTITVYGSNGLAQTFCGALQGRF
jgi:hypothetical protein